MSGTEQTTSVRWVHETGSRSKTAMFSSLVDSHEPEEGVGNARFGMPERVNVDEAVKQLQRLVDKTEYGGSRLEQAFGKDAANRILQDMYAAQRSGVKYMNQQVWAKRIAKALGVGTAGSLGYEGMKGLLSR
jgi:hypothetical protein